MNYYNLQITYNFTVANKKEENEVLSRYEEAGKTLESLPHFEVKEIKRQTPTEVFEEMDI